MIEQGIIFNSHNRQLIAIEHLPTVTPLNKAVIIVVGGPQTRVGSHRLFVYLARTLAEQGLTVFRFDYTGSGDSEGEVSTFTEIQADIHAAIETFQQRHSDIEEITLWGLCDAASAILLYLNEYPQPKNVKQLVLVNPWVRQAHTQAKAYLQSYYIKRFFSKAFWLKLLSGKLEAKKAYQDIQGFHQQSNTDQNNQKTEHYVNRMFDGIKRFNGKSNIVLSGNDLTADEFTLLIKENKNWREMVTCSTINTQLISHADHTFSQQEHQSLLFKITAEVIMKKNS